ncbi:MAG: hypothetical protein ABFE08_15925 [Armatimonadia bacterium]
MMRRLLVVMVAAMAVQVVSAETLTLAPPQSRVEYGKTGEYHFKAPDTYRSARLLVSIRMDSPETSGSTHALRMRVNGEPITGALDRTNMRLLNKPMTARMASGLELPWVRDTSWRVVYAPDFRMAGAEEAGGNRIVEVSPYRLELNVTDLVKRGTENVLLLEHLGEGMRLRTYFPETKPSLDFVLEQLAVEFSDEPAAGVRKLKTETFSADRLMVQPPATAEARKVVTVQPGGGMKITLPGMGLQVTSRFSYQGGGFNVLDAREAAGQPEWKVKVRPQRDGATVEGQAKEYTLQRRVRMVGDHVEVEDRLTNLTGEAIGLAFDNHVGATEGDISEAWLGGNPDPANKLVERLENSTVFVSGDQSGCGLLVVDDVYRIQGALYYEKGAGARSNSFALAPKASYTLRWSLYPVLRPDYYDFINLARRDLGVNFTIPGGFQFGLGAASDEAYKEIAEQRGLRFMSSGVWMDPKGDVKCYHGEHMLQATAMQQKLREQCAAIRRAIPQVKSLVYIHGYINTDPDGPRKHPDAQITTEDGKQYENEGYTKSCGIPFLYNYPALNPENSYVAAMKRVIDMVLDKDKIGADGVYWDELDWISTPYTYDRWDGYSVELDDQYRIKRQRSFVHLLSLSAKVELIKYIFDKGGLLIGNSVATSDTMTKLHFPRFVETAAGWYPARSHLYTPISLGDHLTVKDFPSLVNDIRQKLIWGSLYYYYATPRQPYPTITQHMFPFTPVELHGGWLVGKERIVTAVPGTFTFGDTKPVKVYWYDAAGKETEKRGEERVEKGKRLVRLGLAEGEMAVIER